MTDATNAATGAAANQAAAPTVPPVSTVVQQALGQIQQDAVTSFWGVVKTALGNIKANGSVSNDVAQGLAIAPGLAAALPTFEQNVSQDLAGDVQAELQAFVDSIAATAKAA